MPQKHSRLTPAGRAVWHTERLWHLARHLPLQTIAVSSIAELDQDCWFGPDQPPTCRAVAEHAQRIWNADLAFPIILTADGKLMDGGHRLAKAWLLGAPTIQAVQFPDDPAPDYVLSQA